MLLSRPPFPEGEEEVAQLLRTTFLASATARAFVLHLDDWYGLLSLRAQPYSPLEEMLLAGTMKCAQWGQTYVKVQYSGPAISLAP